MDLTIRLPGGTFNFRVAAVMIHEGKLLIMRDSLSPCWYLPGGRVQLQERAEQALVRELQEELGICATLQRPLWLAQSFYREPVTGESYHELGLYLLTDISKTDLLSRGEIFCAREEQWINTFRWVDFDSLRRLRLYPQFLKEQIFHLPQALRLVTDIRPPLPGSH